MMIDATECFAVRQCVPIVIRSCRSSPERGNPVSLEERLDYFVAIAPARTRTKSLLAMTNSSACL
ncbi:MAG: hypothetical protein JWP21_1152 [Tardiphaga sp.]|nr:hypothetical protein [Tardiphaga sp.]